MEVPDQNDDEKSRLANLESYQIMDTGREVCFDQLAFLASTICQTPIALISFIDLDRQWFKSSYGIDLHEIPRYLSACNQTIKGTDPYIIEDVQCDQSEYREFMAKQGLKFYAGVPITSVDGYNLGALCVIDYEPRSLGHDQIKTLYIIANQIMDLMELRKKYQQNLSRLKELGNFNHRFDKNFQDIAHQAGTLAMAELSAGLSYRIKPFVMAISNAEKRLEATCPNPEVSKELKILTDSSKAVLHIVDSLERFIQAEQEKSMKPMEFNEVINSVIMQLDFKIKSFDIELILNIENDLFCIGNFSQLKEVVFAVINNAVEAVENMKIRRIEIVVREKNHKISMYVKDSGMGIADHIRPFIFQPFFTTKVHQGQGIGLSLAQSLLQRHSGEIKLLKSKDPTIFFLMIPGP
jgi:signal transduction histidine kinase